jgi:hypothetical protein
MIDAVRPKVSFVRLFAILGLTAIAALSGCTPPPPPPPKVVAPPPPVAGNPLDKDLPTYFRLPNTPPGVTPIRVGVILPFSSANPATRNLAAAMLKSASLALFDSGNSNILLITADEGAGPDPSQRELYEEMIAFPYADRDDLADTAATGCAYLLDRREPRAW